VKWFQGNKKKKKPRGIVSKYQKKKKNANRRVQQEGLEKVGKMASAKEKPMTTFPNKKKKRSGRWANARRKGKKKKVKSRGVRGNGRKGGTAELSPSSRGKFIGKKKRRKSGQGPRQQGGAS